MTEDRDTETPNRDTIQRFVAAHQTGPQPPQTVPQASASPKESTRWSHDWALPPLTPGAWRDVSPEDSDTALGIYAEDMANEHIPNFLSGADIERLRATPLGFYPGWLLFECQMTLKNGPRVLFSFLLGPDGAVLLDGTREPLIALAAHLRYDFSAESVAGAYVRFFCDMLRTREGRFLIVSSWNELDVLADTDAKTRAALAKAVRRPSQSAPGDEGTRVLTTVLYAGNLSYVTFLVTPEGLVVMEEDHLVMEDVPVVPEHFEGPFRLVEA